MTFPQPPITSRRFPPLRIPERKTVTVCIAAACDSGEDERKIVFCTDWMVSGPLGHSEKMLKIRKMSDHWRLMTAGDDDEINAFIPMFRNAFSQNKSIDETNILTIIRKVVADRKNDKINEIIQAKFGLDYQTLLNIGKDKLPSEIYRDAILEIRDTTMRAEFILAGFCGAFPMLVEVTREGTPRIREDFAAVGSGSFLAQASLLHRGQSDALPLGKVLYFAFEAKKYAEREVSVGEYTTITILGQSGKYHNVVGEGQEWLQEKYKKYGPQAVPIKMELPEDFPGS